MMFSNAKSYMLSLFIILSLIQESRGGAHLPLDDERPRVVFMDAVPDEAHINHFQMPELYFDNLDFEEARQPIQRIQEVRAAIIENANEYWTIRTFSKNSLLFAPFLFVETFYEPFTRLARRFHETAQRNHENIERFDLSLYASQMLERALDTWSRPWDAKDYLRSFCLVSFVCSIPTPGGAHLIPEEEVLSILRYCKRVVLCQDTNDDHGHND